MFRVIRASHLVVGLAVALLAAAPASSQSLTSGVVRGSVRDAGDGPVEGARLVLRDEETGIVRSVATPLDGTFEFTFVPPGAYSLQVERFGFRPRYLAGLLVHAGQSQALPIALSTEWEGLPVDTVRLARQAAAGTAPGLQVRTRRQTLAAFPDARRDLMEAAARLASQVGEDLAMQGLPSGQTGIRVDGAMASPLDGGGAAIAGPGAPPMPVSAAEQVDIVLTNPDVEWSGFSSGSLDTFARRGSRRLRVEGFGTWAHDAPASGSAAGTAGSEHPSLQGGFALSGPLLRDTASYVVGVEAWRLAGPSAWPANEFTGRAADIARATYDVDLGAPGSATDPTEVVTGFGRVDWQLSAGHALTLRANATSILSASSARAELSGAPIGRPYAGQDVSAALTLASNLSPWLAQELRVGFEHDQREVREVAPGGPAASTRILAAGLEFGPRGGGSGSSARTTVRASQVLYTRIGNHRVKLGAWGGVSALDQVYQKRAQEFLFSGLSDFSIGEAFLVAPLGQPTSAKYALPEASVFAQDTWTAAPGLDLLVGLRLDKGWLPVSAVPRNEGWLAASGLATDSVASGWTHLSPRVGFVWDVQDRHRWVLNGSAGLYTGATDVAHLGEAVSSAGGIAVRRGYGQVGGWPSVPDSSVAGDVGTSLTLLAPGFAPPRTARASLSLSHALAGGTTIQVAGLFRHTTRLSRRVDLNLVSSPVASDQHGRGVYGHLRQRGGIVFPADDSNRRFPAFDAVYAVNADGWSRYTGVMLHVDHPSAGWLRWLGSYTYSRTTDNRSQAGEGARDAGLSPFPDDSTRWMEGTSDLDVPHRLALGAVLGLPALEGVQLTTLYRFRSGYAFTPGFALGVDANGDGSYRNDPAYVDGAIAGMDEVLSRWNCLRDQQGAFARRNSCRTEGVHSLDLRLGVSLVRAGRYSIHLTADGLNLLRTAGAYTDRALYGSDEAQNLVEDRARGTVRVPLAINPNFGNSLVRFQDGRVLRLGLRLSY